MITSHVVRGGPLLELALVEVCQLGLDDLLGAVAVLGAEHLRHVGQLDGAVRRHVGRQQPALPLADLRHAVQQLVEAQADRGLLQTVELLVSAV